MIENQNQNLFLQNNFFFSFNSISGLQDLILNLKLN
jgi:hypothetical protein